MDTTLHVKDAMTYYGNWDQNFLFDNITKKVLALAAPSSGDGPDIIGCGRHEHATILNQKHL